MSSTLWIFISLAIFMTFHKIFVTLLALFVELVNTVTTNSEVKSTDLIEH